MTDPELSHGRRTTEPHDPELAADASNGSNDPNADPRDELARALTPQGAAEAGETLGGSRRSLGWTLALLLLLVGVFALKEAFFWKPPLSFTVGASGQSGVLGDWEEAPDDARLPIRFSDGTLIELEPLARARVEAVGRAGAAVALESGHAHLNVMPAPFRVPGEMRWQVGLGPYSADAKAARFDVDWDPRSDELTLDLFEGTLSIDGCEGSHTISAAEGMRASCDRGHWSLTTLDRSSLSAPTGSARLSPALPK